MADYQSKLKKMEEKYQTLKKQAEDKLAEYVLWIGNFVQWQVIIVRAHSQVVEPHLLRQLVETINWQWFTSLVCIVVAVDKTSVSMNLAVFVEPMKR